MKKTVISFLLLLTLLTAALLPSGALAATVHNDLNVTTGGSVNWAENTTSSDAKIGTVNAGGTCNFGDSYTANISSFQLTAVAETGYTFKGWYTEWNSTSPSLKSSSTSFTWGVNTAQSGPTLYAVFEQSGNTLGLCLGSTEGGSYTVEDGTNGITYNPEGPITGSMNISITQGNTLNLKATPTDGYIFEGWYEGVVGSNHFVTGHTDKLISADAAYTFKVSEYVALQAVFAETSTVSYDANGGSGSMAAATVKTGGTLTLPACGFTAPEGKEFDKWDQGAVGAAITVNSDLTVKAVWKDKPAEPDPVSYAFTSGESVSWTKGSSDSAEFTVRGSPDDTNTFDKFTGIQVDGKAVASDQYTAAKGSVKISLKAAYLETLSTGDHTLKVLFSDGSAEKKFTIKAQSTPAPAEAHQFTFTKVWKGEAGKSIDWTLCDGQGNVVHKTFDKKVSSSTEWHYTATFDSDEGYYIVEKVPSGYTVTYQNVGAHAAVTDRCFNGGTIINEKVPQTGDSASLLLWFGCMLAGLAVMFLLIRAGRGKARK